MMSRQPPLPQKLETDLRKSRPKYVAAFRQLLENINHTCPITTIESQERYSAMYKDGHPFVYIEPQQSMIVFGFFKDYLDKLDRPTWMRDMKFQPWNTSKGGLIGFGLPGYNPDIGAVVVELQRMIEESYRWS